MKKVGLDYDAIEVGMELGTSVNFVTKASIFDYVQAVEDYDPIYFDENDAKAAGYEKIVAPAGFHIQYTAMKWATGQAGYVPQGSVHVRQQHKILGLAYEGDCLNTTVSIGDKYEKKGRKYVVHKITVTNQHGEVVCVSNYINMLPA